MICHVFKYCAVLLPYLIKPFTTSCVLVLHYRCNRKTVEQNVMKSFSICDQPTLESNLLGIFLPSLNKIAIVHYLYLATASWNSIAAVFTHFRNAFCFLKIVIKENG